MDSIERYLEAVSRQLGGGEEESENLKQDMRAEINRMVKELNESGFSEEDSINIALKKFGEEYKIEKKYLKKFRTQKNFMPSRKIMIPTIFAVLLAVFLSGLYAGYKNKEINSWSQSLIAPDAITIMNKIPSGEVDQMSTVKEVRVEDPAVIEKFMNIIKNAKSREICSDKEAGSFKLEDIKFTTGIIVHGALVPVNTISSVNVLKDGTFFAAKITDTNKIGLVHIKGKLGADDIRFLEDIYENFPAIK